MFYFLRATAGCLLGLVLLAGCASIVSKSTYPVTITSNPESVNIKITELTGNVIYEGMTPTTLPLKASAGYFKPAIYEVTLSLDGYKPQNFLIEAKIDGWYFGNFAFGGPLGFFVIDPLTGAMWKLPSEYYNFSLAADDEASNKSLRIITIDEVPEQHRDKLVPLGEGSKN